MTVMNDRWIIHQSTIHQRALIAPGGHFERWWSDREDGSPVLSPRQELEGYTLKTMLDPERCMIQPFHAKGIRAVENIQHPDYTGPGTVEQIKIISKGVTSFGYDVTLDHDLKVFANNHGGEINPKAIDQSNFFVPVIKYDPEFGVYVSMPPNSYMLGVTVEFFRIPRDILVICLGKSTYARAGIIVNVTPIEPEWKGKVVIEVANTTSLPARVYLDEGIAQFVFLQGNEPCAVSYEDKGGKYQGQNGLVDAMV